MNPLLRRRPFLRMVGLAGVAATARVRADDRPAALFIDAYAGEVSVPQGGEVALHVSTSQRRFSVEIARLGAKREVVWNGTSDAGAEHPIPEDASSNGCRWPVALRVPIPATLM